MAKKIILLVIILLVVAGGGFWFWQNQDKVPKIKKTEEWTVAIINPGGATYTKFFDGFQTKLKEIYRNKEEIINVVYENADGDSIKLKEMISYVVSIKPDIIVTISSPPTLQALEETKDNKIPVLTALGDPIEHGYVQSLKSSGTNLTGIAQQNIELTPKRLEILKKISPSVKRVAIFYDTNCGPTKKARPIANSLAPTLDLTLIEFPLTNPTKEDLAQSLKTVTKKDFDALMFYPHGTLFSKASIFLKKAEEEKLLIIMPDEDSLIDGGVASYGPNYYDMGVNLARQAEKILTGIEPKDIPFEQPKRIDFVINLLSAERMGVVIPQEIMETADKVIK